MVGRFDTLSERVLAYKNSDIALGRPFSVVGAHLLVVVWQPVTGLQLSASSKPPHRVHADTIHCDTMIRWLPRSAAGARKGNLLCQPGWAAVARAGITTDVLLPAAQHTHLCFEHVLIVATASPHRTLCTPSNTTPTTAAGASCCHMATPQHTTSL